MPLSTRGRGRGRNATLSARGRGGAAARTVVTHSDRGAAGVKITLSQRFEGSSASAPKAARGVLRGGRDPVRTAGGSRDRGDRPLPAVASRGRVRGGIHKSATARPVAKVAPGRVTKGRGVVRAAGRATGRESARAAGRGAGRNAGRVAGRNAGRNAGRGAEGRGAERGARRGAGRSRGRDNSRDESLTLADMDAGMDAWKNERSTGQEKVLKPVESTAEGDAAPGATEGDAAPGAADEGGGAQDDGDGADSMNL